MSSAAQQTEMTEVLDFEAAGALNFQAANFQAAETDSASGLKQVVAQRLAAHRNRRADAKALEAAQETAAAQVRSQTKTGASRVREAVAARYEHSPSYHEFLAAEAERAAQQAQAEAEIASRNARAVAAAQMKLLEELDQWNRPAVDSPLERPATEAAIEASSRGLTVRLYENSGAVRATPGNPQSLSQSLSQSRGIPTRTVDGEHELSQLEQEIEFRRAPEFELHAIEPPLPIPGNLIEFPRQLVASRKARPRLAEGPLREDAPAAPQLRIFEVEPEQISIEPEAATISSAPEWQGLLLDPAKISMHAAPVDAQHHFTLQPQTAPLELRLMATTVDGCCIGAAFLSFAAVVARLAGPGLRTLSLPLLGISAAGVLLALFAIYQMLFFSLSEATPGMRYARIALCTFGDGNPTRKAMRRRLLAILLAACPLGIGLAWTFMDDERLGWHDRISRMYQRAY